MPRRDRQSGLDRQNDLLAASLLVHEEWHLRHGADERGAYLAQLTALHALGFDEHSSVYWGVKKAMLRVVAATAQPAG